MNQFLRIAVLLLVFTAWKHVNAENLEPQIKAISVDVDSLNHKYLTRLSYSIEKKNATYNNLPIKWTFIRDLPPVVVSISIYATDEKHENPELLLTENVPICSESRYRELLPKPLVIPESMLRDNCLKKGDLNSNDFGIFRFDVLMPNIHEISDYYKINYKYTTVEKQEFIAEVTVFAEWGYLHTE